MRFMFEGDHTITDSFSISKNGVASDVQTQLNDLLSTLNNDVATLNDSIASNVQTLNDTITSNYDALNTAKQDKGNYVTIDANNAITLAENVTFCTLTPTE